MPIRPMFARADWAPARSPPWTALASAPRGELGEAFSITLPNWGLSVSSCESAFCAPEISLFSRADTSEVMSAAPALCAGVSEAVAPPVYEYGLVDDGAVTELMVKKGIGGFPAPKDLSDPADVS